MENPQESIRLSVKKVLLILFMLVLNRKCDDIQIDSRAHLASYSMGTGVLSWGGESSWCVKLTTQLHLVLRSRMSGAVLPPPECIHVMDRENFNFL